MNKTPSTLKPSSRRKALAGLLALAALTAHAQLVSGSGGGSLVGGKGSTTTNPGPQAPKARPARIRNVVVRFVNGSDGKDSDTNLNVYIYPNGTRADMGNERKGSILGYESRNRPTPFAANSTTEIVMTGYTGPNGYAELPTILDWNTFFRTHGGRLHLNCYRNGHDTWVVKSMDVTINYVGDDPQTIHFPGFTTREGDGPRDFDFGSNLQVRG